MELLLVVPGGQVSSLKRIIVPSASFLHIIPFNLLVHIFYLVEFSDDFLIHLRRVTVPTIFLGFISIPHFFSDIISCDQFVVEPGSYSPGPLSAIFPAMTHGSTVLTSSLTERTGLKSFLTSVVPIRQVALGFIGGYFDELASSLGVLSIPRQLFDIIGSILFPLHLLL